MLSAQITLKWVQKMLGLKQKLQIQWEGPKVSFQDFQMLSKWLFEPYTCHVNIDHATDLQKGLRNPSSFSRPLWLSLSLSLSVCNGERWRCIEEEEKQSQQEEGEGLFG